MTTLTTIDAIKKFATTAAIAGALGLAALGLAGTAAAAPAADSGSTTSSASEQAGPGSPTGDANVPASLKLQPALGADGSANAGPSTGTAQTTAQTPTSSVGNGRQSGDTADDSGTAANQILDFSNSSYSVYMNTLENLRQQINRTADTDSYQRVIPDIRRSERPASSTSVDEIPSDLRLRLGVG
ncbi:hypothetical protein [Mycolicibacterium hodleri]|uniref:Uncharacterized protein n=1 Tax=Mycolicibacterium hodleri TaxID=49897 RepID=A0A502EKT1_9MYCO|nr:hypothetical protein [Mycolicibacterium hodleri]TPG37096.1 hypothetical protein EAH80_04350 [Mycolicibacterium hodleri]